MAVISFNFTSVHAEQTKPVKGKIKINNNIGITSADKADITFADTSKSGVKFGFEFVAKYEPEIGHVTIKGSLVYLQETDKIEKILETWKKDKKVDGSVQLEIMSNILNKCNIEALIISRDVGLPSPIPLPKLQPKKA